MLPRSSFDMNGIGANISKIEGLKLEKVTTRKRLQSLLGVLNWYRPFIPAISTKLSEIYDLLKGGNKKINLKPEHKSIINKILCEIMNAPTLHHPDLN